MDAVKREEMRGTVRGLLKFVLQSVMTEKQEGLFDFLVSAMMVIPDSES